MLSLRSKIKLLVLLVLCLATLSLTGPAQAGTCGSCAQVFDGTVGVGWGCVAAEGTTCVATSTGCTQCTSCSCDPPNPD